MAGAFVTDDVPYTSPQGSASYTLVSDQISQNNAKADSFVLNFQQAAENVTATELYSPDFSELEKNIKDLALPRMPTKPNISVALDNNWPSTAIQEPAHQDVKVDINFEDPTVPDSLSPDFNYTPGTYYSKIWTPLCDALLGDLVSGGTGLTEAVYQGIIDRSNEARRRNDDAARLALNRKFGGPGALMPSGAYMSAVSELEEDIRRGKRDTLNEILIKDFDLADANTKFVKSLLQTVEQMLRTDYNSSEERLFNIASGAKELAIKIYEQNAKIYNSKWEGLRVKFEVAKLEIDAKIAANASADDNYKTRAAVLDTRVNAIASKNKSITDSALANASVYNSELQGVAIEINALISEIQTQKDLYLADLQAVLGKEGLNLQAYTSASELNSEKLVALAQMFSQSVASALGMTNTGITYGTSYGRTQSHNFSLSNSLSESHSFQEV